MSNYPFWVPFNNRKRVRNLFLVSASNWVRNRIHTSSNPWTRIRYYIYEIGHFDKKTSNSKDKSVQKPYFVGLYSDLSTYSFFLSFSTPSSALLLPLGLCLSLLASGAHSLYDSPSSSYYTCMSLG